MAGLSFRFFLTALHHTILNRQGDNLQGSCYFPLAASSFYVSIVVSLTRNGDL